MSLTPWNRQEEWYQQMINAATGKYLPSVDAEDAGKVLTVGQDGSWEADAIPQELPTVEETDKDKFLHTNGTTGDLEWADAPSGMPEVTTQDAGKVATVNNSGEWVAANPSGGSELPTPTSADVGKVATVVEESGVGETIVPEQLVLFDEEGSWYNCQNTNASLFEDGKTVIVTIATRHTTVVRTAVITSGSVVVKDTDGRTNLTIADNGSGTIRCKEPASQYETERTLTVTLQSTTLSWGIGGGSGGGPLMVTMRRSGSTLTLNKTWQEIKDANAVSIHWDDDGDHRNLYYVGGVYYNAGVGYGLSIFTLGGGSREWFVDGLEFTAASADGYPSITMG